MTKVEVDRAMLDKAAKEAEALAARVSHRTGQEFYNAATGLGQNGIKEYGLNAKRLIEAVQQLYAKATVHTEVEVPGELNPTDMVSPGPVGGSSHPGPK